VAALYDAADVTNPGGESLPSDPIPVSLPDTGGLSVAITWEAVDRAVGYRVYRSADADTSGAEEWVGDTTAPSFRDDGLPTDSARVPLPEGAIGAWAALPALLQAREAACVAVAPDPIPDPQIVYLIQADGPVLQAGLGDQANFSNIAAGSTTTGLSQCTANSSLVGAASTGQLKIVGLGNGLDNAWGDAYTVIQVQINKSQFQATVVAI
jgi:hypothetical protein